MSRLLGVATPVLFLALLLGIWEWLCWRLDVQVYFLPPPSAIWTALLANAPLLFRSAWNTFLLALMALGVASLVACLLALGTGLSRTVELALRPLAVALQVTPVVALAPLIQIWAGIDHPRVAVVALTAVVAFFPIYSGAVSGLKSADPDLERLFDLYGASPLQRLFKLRVPSAAPFLLEGHKVAVGLALVGAVVAEFAAGSGAGSGAEGLAWRILEAAHHLQTAKMMAALVVLAGMGAALHAVFSLFEQRALAWWRGR